ncbi:MAG: GumC family protein, partial [Spirochaetota bacterium]
PLPNYFESQAQILLSDPSSGGGVANSLSNADLGLLTGLRGLGGGQGESSAALAEELLRGNSLISEIVEEFDLVEEFADADAPLTAARNSVREALTTEFDNTSGVLKVSYESIDPIFATDVLQRVVTLLESRFTYLTRDDARARTQAIELQLQQLEDDLQQARDSLTSFQQRYGVIDPQNQGRQTIDLIAQFRQRKFDLELEREQIYELVQNRDDPQIQRINQDIRRIEELIAELETGYRIYSPISIPLDEIGPLTVQYTELQRDLLLKEQVYSTFQAELIRARIESQDTTPRFQVIEPPEVPEVKAGPSRGLISMIVTITAFFLSIFLAFVLEYFARARHDPEEARKLEAIRNQFRRHRKA